MSSTPPAIGTAGVPWRPAFSSTISARVVDVGYDYLEGARFRHPPQFVRWRPDRDPASWGCAQLDQPSPFDVGQVLAGRLRADGSQAALVIGTARSYARPTRGKRTRGPFPRRPSWNRRSPAATASPSSREDLAEANEQQTATSQVLEVIGRSDFRLEPVFETVVRHAVRLCRADCGYVYQLDGDVFRIAFIVGGTPEYRELHAASIRSRRVPRRSSAGSGWSGASSRSPTCSPTRLPVADRARARGLPDDARRADARGRPRRRRADALAARGRSVRRPDDRPPRRRFAAQAAIAIQNVELFQELSSAAAARVGRELRALGEISQAVSLEPRPRRGARRRSSTRAAQLSAPRAARSSSSTRIDRAVRAAHLRRDRARAGRRAAQRRGSTSTRRSSGARLRAAEPLPGGGSRARAARSPRRDALRAPAGARCWRSRCDGSRRSSAR